MSLEKAESYLKEAGFLDHVIELKESTATVALAAEALGVEPGMIAKTMSFLQGEQPVLILTEGTAKVDNRKYKDTFHVKAKMIPFEQVEEVTGHAPGGVCPFGIKDGIEVYLDESLKRFETVYPAAGDDHSAVRLTIPELEEVSGAKGWVDVCREPEDQQRCFRRRRRRRWRRWFFPSSYKQQPGTRRTGGCVSGAFAYGNLCDSGKCRNHYIPAPGKKETGGSP